MGNPVTTPPGPLALPWLYAAVSARLAADQTPVTNAFGWRIPAQHPYGNRIAWVPGDPSGSLGLTGPVRNPGGLPRSLATLNETFTCIIYGEDLSEPENELKQYSMCRYLRDAWYRAVYYVAYGAFTLRLEQWITDRLERRHGAALRCVCELQTNVPDVPWNGGGAGLAPIDTGAEIDVTELDVTETILAQANEPEPHG